MALMTEKGTSATCPWSTRARRRHGRRSATSSGDIIADQDFTIEQLEHYIPASR
jgi:hypothetical protein